MSYDCQIGGGGGGGGGEQRYVQRPPYDSDQRQRSANSNARLGIESGQHGAHVCDVVLDAGRRCSWRSHSALSVQLHRADRHLVYPAGGKEALELLDPLLEEDRREQAKRQRRRGASREDAEDKANALIVGLNIELNTPELTAKWLAERRKRWPTAAVVRQKRLHSWDEPLVSKRSSVNDQRDAERPKMERRIEREKYASNSSSESESESGAEGDGVGTSSSSSSSENSDVDEERDAISSKIPPAFALNEREKRQRELRPLCRFFQRGNCRNGAQCSHRHETEQKTAQHQTPQRKRKRPRAASPNPFEAPHLLRALLQNEIAQHVNYVAQVIRFVVRNDYLDNVERCVGEADEQAQRRRRIVDLHDGDVKGAPNDDMAHAPLVNGGAIIVGNGLYQPRSPTLKPLSDLSLPPEPDEFALMDPLRKHDVKPLTHLQYLQIAQDQGVRTLLCEERTTTNQPLRLAKGMMRALSTLDALPSLAHRASALEQILGVSQQSALHAHQIGSTYVRSDRQPSAPSNSSGGGGRVIGEQELFRLGLRVGVTEIQRIRLLASRVSAVLGGPTFDVTEELNGNAIGSANEMQPWWDAETRQAMRVRQWHREADWRDQMRKLGVDVD